MSRVFSLCCLFFTVLAWTSRSNADFVLTGALNTADAFQNNPNAYDPNQSTDLVHSVVTGFVDSASVTSTFDATASTLVWDYTQYTNGKLNSYAYHVGNATFTASSDEAYNLTSSWNGFGLANGADYYTYLLDQTDNVVLFEDINNVANHNGTLIHGNVYFLYHRVTFEQIPSFPDDTTPGAAATANGLYSFSVSSQAVPVPASLTLLLTGVPGFVGIGWLARRRRKTEAA